MNIYEKIEKIFQNQELDRPPWADEILQELREIKAKLQEPPILPKQIYANSENYDFIKEFRKEMRADVAKNME